MRSPRISTIGCSGPRKSTKSWSAKARELSRKLQPDAEADIEQFASVIRRRGRGLSSRLASRRHLARRHRSIAPSLASVLLPAEVGSADVWYYEPVIPEPRIQPMVMQTIDTMQASEARSQCRPSPRCLDREEAGT